MMQEWRRPNDPDYRCDGELWQFKGTVRVLCCHVSTTKLEKFMLFQPDDVTCSCGTFYLIFDFLANNFDFFLIIFNFLIQQFGLFVSYLWLSISWFDLSIYLSIYLSVTVYLCVAFWAHMHIVCQCASVIRHLHLTFCTVQSSTFKVHVTRLNQTWSAMVFLRVWPQIVAQESPVHMVIHDQQGTKLSKYFTYLWMKLIGLWTWPLAHFYPVQRWIGALCVIEPAVSQQTEELIRDWELIIDCGNNTVLRDLLWSS